MNDSVKLNLVSDQESGTGQLTHLSVGELQAVEGGGWFWGKHKNNLMCEYRVFGFAVSKKCC